MKKRTLIFLAIFAALFTFVGSTSAHQPRLVEGEETVIQNPEVSQAFYGTLTGGPHQYTIDSDIPFRLYVGILVPDLPDIDTDLTAHIDSSDHTFKHILDGTTFTWTPFHEEFGGDDYLDGPELKDPSHKGSLPRGIEVPADRYTITVSSIDNEGKYVLVVGEKEEFPFSEIVHTIKTLPSLKADFFEKSPLSAYSNLVGLFMLGPIIIVSVLIVLIVYIVKKRRRKRK